VPVQPLVSPDAFAKNDRGRLPQKLADSLYRTLPDELATPLDPFYTPAPACWKKQHHVVFSRFQNLALNINILVI
jgi:hypothetical protein